MITQFYSFLVPACNVISQVHYVGHTFFKLKFKQAPGTKTKCKIKTQPIISTQLTKSVSYAGRHLLLAHKMLFVSLYVSCLRATSPPAVALCLNICKTVRHYTDADIRSNTGSNHECHATSTSCSMTRQTRSIDACSHFVGLINSFSQCKALHCSSLAI